MVSLVLQHNNVQTGISVYLQQINKDIFTVRNLTLSKGKLKQPLGMTSIFVFNSALK